MTYRFKPLPDITAYELALVVEHMPHSGPGVSGVFATDGLMQGDDKDPIPECLRRHFEKLPIIR